MASIRAPPPVEFCYSSNTPRGRFADWVGDDGFFSVQPKYISNNIIIWMDNASPTISSILKYETWPTPWPYYCYVDYTPFNPEIRCFFHSPRFPTPLGSYIGFHIHYINDNNQDICNSFLNPTHNCTEHGWPHPEGDYYVPPPGESGAEIEYYADMEENAKIQNKEQEIRKPGKNFTRPFATNSGDNHARKVGQLTANLSKTSLKEKKLPPPIYEDPRTCPTRFDQETLRDHSHNFQGNTKEM